jgi:preprotein translocase subunit SecA
MNSKNYIDQLKRLHRRLRGSMTEYDLSGYWQMVHKIRKKHLVIKSHSDQKIKKEFQSIKNSISEINDLDITLIDISALTIEAIKRTLKLSPFDVQLIGAIAMHRGKISQMNTGEGKTLTAVFPAVINALNREGVHILTFNDYLARRDAEWMGPAYNFLGLSVGFVQEGMSIEMRKKAYAADITYLSAKEAGFDYLRDSLCYDKNNIVHRPFNFVIIDEADSILIDEARIPLVIAGTEDELMTNLHQYSRIVREFKKGIHYEFDEYARNIHLTDKGLSNAEKELKCKNLYAQKNLEKLTGLNCATHAEFLLHKDVDYIVKNGKIELVDEYTGRVADKRRWPDGLQAALEAKENLDVQSRGKILNSITLQHFVKLYPKFCGMTATAEIAEEEFKRFYNLDIVVIPPNKASIRIDYPNRIFFNKEIKYTHLMDEISMVHESGRPILVGTASVDESEKIAMMLRNKGIDCSVLNAKQDIYEAKIIAEAGKIGAVTISTNMAGRGTDIRLGGSDESEKVKVLKMGGLYVIGTNLHESKRIDQQLRGRSGRQGDPGSTQFFISLEDDLLIKYKLDELIPESIKNSLVKGEIDHLVVRKEVNRIQRICEGQNLEIKKTLTKYSDLIERQRQILYKKRMNILYDLSAYNFIKQEIPEKYDELKTKITEDELNNSCRHIYLFHFDSFWSEYLSDIADIRESIHLKRVGGEEPFFEFQKMAIQIFDERWIRLEISILNTIKKINIKNGLVDLDDLGIRAPSATWTYLVNDNPFEKNLGMQLIGDTGMQVAAGIFGPLLALELFFRKKKKQ